MKIYGVELRGYNIKIDLRLISILNTVSINGKWTDKTCSKHGLRELTIEFKTLIDIMQLVEIFEDYNFDISVKYQGGKL